MVRQKVGLHLRYKKDVSTKRTMFKNVQKGLIAKELCKVLQTKIENAICNYNNQELLGLLLEKELLALKESEKQNLNDD